MRFSPYDMHVEGLATAAWTQTKEITIIGEFLLAFLARDVYGYRYTLAVGVIDFQRCVLALGKFLFVHKTAGGITQGEETVVVLVQGIAVAGEGADKQFQLVIGSLTDLYSDSSEAVLQMVGAFLQVSIGLDGDDEVEMAIYQLLVLSCNKLFHFLDVFYGNLVAGIG